MRSFRIVGSLLLLVGLGCQGVESTEAALGQEFELAPNQSTRIAGTPLIVGFRRVTTDNRCPIDAVCVAEGRAGIELEIFGGAASGPVELGTPLPAAWTDGHYRVEAVDLRPDRTASSEIRPDEYRLRLLVDLARRP